MWLKHVSGGLSDHHQERTTALGASGFTVWTEAAGALLVVVCQTTTNNTPAACLQTVKPEALSAVVCS